MSRIKYAGTKIIKAEPMSLGNYNNFKGWKIPADEDPNKEGYLIEYSNDYISWSPKEVFDAAYYPVNGLPFGVALEALKQGKRITRAGWNGKGMFLFLLPAGTVPTMAIHDPALRQVIEEESGGDTFEALGSIRMWTTNSAGRKAVLTGWLASQTDMLSDDWEVL